MTLPASGPLTLANIQTEFGGSNPISLNEYYAGGANVPAGTSGTYGAVPSSGTISIRNFYGTSNIALGFDANFLMTSNGNSPSFQQASFSLLSNTTTSASAVNVITAATRWATPTTAGIGNLYEARLEVSSIVTTIDPTQIQFAGVNVTAVGNTPYYALSATRSLVVTAYTNPQVGNSDFAQCIGTVRVQRIGNPSIFATATFSLTANADF